MALIKCTECGHDMSSRAMVCPNCGCPNDNRVRSFDEIIRDVRKGNTEVSKTERKSLTRDQRDLLQAEIWEFETNDEEQRSYIKYRMGVYDFGLISCVNKMVVEDEMRKEEARKKKQSKK